MIMMMYRKWVVFSFFVVSCLSVGLTSSCSKDTFVDEAKSCVNGFFGALKENPKQECRAPYSNLETCIKNVVNGCRNKTDSENLAKMESRSIRMIGTRKYFCEDGMLNSFKRIKLPDCRKRALVRVRKCAESYHKEFRENKGSPSLCRKYSMAKRCIVRTIEKFCQKTEGVQIILKLYQDRYNPYCPGKVDSQKKSVRSAIKPFGSCSERDYLILTRVCLTKFVQTLQKEPKKSCRWVYMNKLHNCAKDIANHCHKNESRKIKKNIERSFADKSSRAYQERRYCDGVNFQISYPLLKRNQCEQNYIAAKEKCEASYIAMYKENKADKTLCRKYAEAKSCIKNATLALCMVTPEIRDEVTFIYDGFNPFCFNLSDPPIAKESRGIGDRVPRETGDQHPIKTIDHVGGSNAPSGGGGQSVSGKRLRFVMVLSLLFLSTVVS